MNKNKPLKISGIVLFILVIGLSACQPTTPTPPAELIKTTLSMGYIPNIQFAPVYVALEKGYFQKAGFDVDLDYNMETDSVALVGAGEQTFTIASGEQVLLARAQGLPVTYVGAWYQEFPVGTVAFKSANIKKPEDLQGATVGIPGLYGASYIGFRALLEVADLREEDLELLSIGFNQVEAMVSEQVEAAVIYLANEPIALQHQGFEVDIIRVADYLELVSNGIVTNEKTIQEKPEMVQGFVGALMKGITDTLANPAEAYTISEKYVENLVEADSNLQKAILAESIKLWQTDQPGYTDPTGWTNMHQVLLKMGLLEAPLELEKAYTNEFIP